jgi:hypothetical protein
MSADPTSSIHSSADSGFYSASECSTPPTPSMHSRGHFRFPSSTSSLSSSPPTHDAIEPPNSSGKLPKLTEEPIEREFDYGNEDPYRCSCMSRPTRAIVAYTNKLQAMNPLAMYASALFPRRTTQSMSTLLHTTRSCAGRSGGGLSRHPRTASQENSRGDFLRFRANSRIAVRGCQGAPLHRASPQRARRQ